MRLKGTVWKISSLHCLLFRNPVSLKRIIIKKTVIKVENEGKWKVYNRLNGQIKPGVYLVIVSFDDKILFTCFVKVNEYAL